MVKVTDFSGSPRWGTLRSRVVWIAAVGLATTVAVLSVITAGLLLERYRAMGDEEITRQLLQIQSASRGTPSDQQSQQLTELVSNSAPSSRILTVLFDSDGQLRAVSVGPEQLDEALTDDPAAMAGLAATAAPTGVSIGDSSLRFVAADAPSGERIVVFTSADDSRDQALLTAFWVAAAGVGCVGVGVWATSWALRRSVQPLTTLAEQTRNLQGLKGEHVPAGDGPAEVQQLSEEINSLLRRIDDEQARRTQFLATVSHEIRTPLTIARGHLEALSRYGPTDHADTQQALDVAETEIVRAGRMVESLLTLARAEEPGFVQCRPVALTFFADDLALRLAGLPITVSMSPPPDVQVTIDAERCAQAVLNAVVNSRMHNDDNVRVRVTWELHDSDLIISIDDDGVGFPPTIPAEELLQAFSHGSPGSSGMGLAVIRVVAEGHGGAVRLATSPQGGARVQLTLPDVLTDETTTGDLPAAAP